MFPHEACIISLVACDQIRFKGLNQLVHGFHVQPFPSGPDILAFRATISGST
jgi:hypothetical protein